MDTEGSGVCRGAQDAHPNTRVYRSLHWRSGSGSFFWRRTADVFALWHGFSWAFAVAGAVLAGTGIAALRGKLPGAEPGPYILRFDEDRPNPLYRKVCYSFAWTRC